MPNPSPRKEFLRPYRAVGDLPDEPLGSQPIAVRVGQSIQAAIHELPRADRITWLRRVITEAAQRELLNQDGEVKE
jgi:hypothetical protein